MPNPTKKTMTATFKVAIVLEKPVRAIPTKLKNASILPLRDLSWLGGTNKYILTGTTTVRQLKQKARIRYEIVSQIVPMVETYLGMGVVSINFEELDTLHLP